MLRVWADETPDGLWDVDGQMMFSEDFPPLEWSSNEGLLDSALARPLNLVAYADHTDATDAPDVAALAACYCYGLAKNHPFVDGNKRAAFLATGLFLYLNGFRLTASQADATMTVLGIASGDLSEAYFANWLRQNMATRKTTKAAK